MYKGIGRTKFCQFSKTPNSQRQEARFSVAARCSAKGPECAVWTPHRFTTDVFLAGAQQLTYVLPGCFFAHFDFQMRCPHSGPSTLLLLRVSRSPSRARGVLARQSRAKSGCPHGEGVLLSTSCSSCPRGRIMNVAVIYAPHRVSVSGCYASQCKLHRYVLRAAKFMPYNCNNVHILLVVAHIQMRTLTTEVER